jgi:hypothetical protein
MEENQKTYEILHSDEYKKNFIRRCPNTKTLSGAFSGFARGGFRRLDKLPANSTSLSGPGPGRELTGEPWIDQNGSIPGCATWSAPDRKTSASSNPDAASCTASAKGRESGLTGWPCPSALGSSHSLFDVSLSRPLRELRRGIRAYTATAGTNPSAPCPLTKLGELGGPLTT